MTRRYRLTAQAETDVREIWVYIGADNVAAADNLVDRFTETFQRLAVTLKWVRSRIATAPACGVFRSATT